MAAPDGAALITTPGDVARLVVALRTQAGLSKLALARSAHLSHGTVANIEDANRDKVLTSLIPVLAVFGKGIAGVDLPAGDDAPDSANPPPATTGTPET